VSTTVPREMLALSARVLACERARHPGEREWSVPVLAAFHQLHDTMSNLVGGVGFDAIVRRAIQLTRREHAWLEPVPIGAPVEIERLADQGNRVDEREATEGVTVLFAMVLQLLSTFIGGELTLRQVRQIWAELSPEVPTADEETP
jgi:hypothetical protein